MTHSICTSDVDGALSYFQRLGRTLLAPGIEPRRRLEHLFERETAEFDLDCAFLSQINVDDETEHFEIVHGSHEKLRPGATFPLSDTYCRRTIADPSGTLAVSDALAEGWGGDPAYETFQLGSYLGTTVSVADELYGTLCFADTAARDEPLVDEEKALVELYGQWVGYILTFWNGPPIGRARVDPIERRAVSSAAIDSMMDALTSRTRRAVLMSLSGATTETSIATLERQLQRETDRIRLYHAHLPKLAHSGYIEWDDDSDTISRGPRFSEVEPLVTLLEAYEMAFPE